MTREGIEVTFKIDKKTNNVMIAAYIKTREMARMFEHFAKNHFFVTAVFITFIAIEVLMILAFYVVEMLRFEKLKYLENELTINFCCTVIKVLIIIQIFGPLRDSLFIMVLCQKVFFSLISKD